MTSYGPLLQFALLSGFVLAVTLTLLIGACERPLRRALSGKALSAGAGILVDAGNACIGGYHLRGDDHCNAVDV